MFRITVIFLSFVLQAQASFAIKSCNEFVQAYNEYTQKVDGQIVKKHSIFEMTDWSRNSRFQGLLLTDKAPENVEVVLITKATGKVPVSAKTKKTTPFAQNDKYRLVDLDLDKQLGKMLGGKGVYTVVVLADGKELCTEKKFIYDDGD